MGQMDMEVHPFPYPCRLPPSASDPLPEPFRILGILHLSEAKLFDNHGNPEYARNAGKSGI